jgi:hypothetical protein
LNIDLSIHRMAFREAESLGLAQMLVARKRQELDLKVQRETVLHGASASNATLDRALKDMEDQSADVQREAPPTGDMGVLIDKTA